MKEIIGKAKHSNESNFSRRLKIDNETKTGPSLAKNIPDPLMSFKSFLKKVSTTLPNQSLSISKLKDAFSV